MERAQHVVEANELIIPEQGSDVRAGEQWRCRGSIFCLPQVRTEVPTRIASSRRDLTIRRRQVPGVPTLLRRTGRKDTK